MTDAVPHNSEDSASAALPSNQPSSTPPLDTLASSAQESITPPRHLWRRVIVWIFALLCGILVPVFVSGEARFEWLTLAVGVSVLLTFALQLGTAQREGFITRIASSIAGSVVIIAGAHTVASLVG